MRYIGWTIAALVLLCVAVGVTTSLLDVPAKQSLKAARADLRRQGLPLTREESIPSPRPASPTPSVTAAPLPPEGELPMDLLLPDDSTEGVAASLRALWRDGKNPDKLVVHLFSLSAEEEAEVDEILHEYDDLIRKARKIVQQQPVPPEESMSRLGLDQPFAWIKCGAPYMEEEALTDLFVLKAYQAHRDGDSREALALCGDLLRLADHTLDIPLWQFQAAEGCFGMLAWFLPRFFLEAKPDPESCKAFDALLSEFIAYEGMTNTLCQLAVNTNETFEAADARRNPEELNEAPWAARAAVSVYESSMFRFVRDRDAAAMLKVQADFVQAARLPYYAARKKYPRIFSDLDKETGWTTPGAKWQAIKLLPVYSVLIIDRAQEQAQACEARIALALERYRAAQGAYPATLKELAPDYLPSLPLDPFSGEHFVYEVDTRGYVLYSVGRNGKSDTVLIDNEDAGLALITTSRRLSQGTDDFVWGGMSSKDY